MGYFEPDKNHPDTDGGYYNRCSSCGELSTFAQPMDTHPESECNRYLMGRIIELEDRLEILENKVISMNCRVSSI